MLSNNAPPNILRHTLRVTEVALLIAEALNKKGYDFDLSLIKRAGVLHDIKREIGKGHDIKGAELVSEIDKKAAKIIKEHMVHKFPKKAESISESDIVAISDRLTKMDEYTSLDEREDEIISRNLKDTLRIMRVKENFKEARDFINILENVLGKTVDEVILGEHPNNYKSNFLDEINIEFKEKIFSLLKDVKKPGRYIGGEINSIVKTNLKDKLRFGFIFPDLYEIGMSFTGLEILYKEVNKFDDLYMERVFSIDNDFEKLLRKNKLPLYTLETFTKVNDLDVIGFTLQYELSYTNILNALDISNIPLLAKDRDDSYPLLIAGGIGSFNPEPLALVFDLFNIGDGELMLPFILRTYKKLKEFGRSKSEILYELNKVPGVYVPSLRNLKSGVIPEIIPDLNKYTFPLNPIIPNIEIVHDRASVEIMRGCKRNCRFCQAGVLYKPVRERSLNSIVMGLFSNKGLIENLGADEISLLSLSTTDYSSCKLLIAKLSELSKEKNISLSLPSLRMDNFDEDFVGKFFTDKKSGLTFAIEAGSERLRKIINKELSEIEILKTIVKIAKLKISKLKLYFMVGLPFETDKDLESIVRLAKKIIEVGELVLNLDTKIDVGEYNINGKQIKKPKKQIKKRFNITVSTSNFVPKPHTPFQYFDPNNSEELLRKNLMLKDLFKNVKGAKYTFHDCKASYVESYISKGDRNTLLSIIDAYKNGAKFDSWGEHFKYEIWDDVIKKYPINTYKFGDELPWDFIKPRIKKDYINNEYLKVITFINEEEARKKYESDPNHEIKDILKKDRNVLTN